MTGRGDGTRRDGPPALDEPWLNSRLEEAIDPDLPIIDAHHHNFWDEPFHYRTEQFLADLTSGHDVRATVYVEGGDMYRTRGPIHLRSVGETEFANGMAAIGASANVDINICAAIVGAVDLTTSSADEALRAHIAAAGGRFRGVRVNAYHDVLGIMSQAPPEGLLRDSDFRTGFGLLGRFGLVADILCFHPQLPDVSTLAEAFPETPIVLNHFGGPLGIGPFAQQGREVMREWTSSMRELAKRENVVVKLGGLTNPYIQNFAFPREDGPPPSHMLSSRLKPFVDRTIDIFGPQRCMFESNFPIDKPACSYVNLWNAFKSLTASLSRDERLAVMGGTAARAYSLQQFLPTPSGVPSANS